MKIKYILLAIIFTGILSSCEDYLSEVPDNRTQIDNKEKVQELLVGAYPDNYYAPFLETMSDNFADKGNISATSNEYLSAYSWEPITTEDSDTPISYWNSCYKAIAQANQALASIEELEGKYDLEAEKAEALLTRAYNHFMLVNIWAKHYDPATADSDLGVPYVLEPETDAIKEYSRNTVQEVYDFIQQDIEEALPLIENNFNQPTFHFTPEAAKAFAVRFYAFKGDWENVVSYSTDILTNPSNKIKDWEYYYDNLQTSEIRVEVMSPQEESNLLLVVPYSNWFEDIAFQRFGLSVNLLNELFQSANPVGKGWAYSIAWYGTSVTYKVNKFDYIFEYTDITADIGYRRTSVALLTYDEVLLARAEANAMLGNYESSVADINIFLSKKTFGYNPQTDELLTDDILNYYQVTSEYQPYYELNEDKAAFVKFIAELRRREFWGEGLRWFDIKRFHLPVVHEFANQPTDTLKTNDLRRELQIPPTATAFGIEDNPR
ncbi:RagB/SusD family nutrient uptake outer membrane protein [Zunongwangia sp.]|uniref:RagB/SusD family nutrient uptake outer membrane protein n=1 Tax=Zunongwangia sp. TaxID=1965325 RepID=UPI003AA97B56